MFAAYFIFCALVLRGLSREANYIFCCSHPVMNHSIGLSLVKSDNTGPWSLGAWLKNAFLRVNSSSRFGDSFYKLLNVTVDVPTASNNVCVTYKFEHDKQHKLIVMVKDGEESRFVCNSTVMLNGTVTWNCSQEQVTFKNMLTVRCRLRLLFRS